MFVPKSFKLEIPLTWNVGWFSTKIFHPNVSSSGEICVNTLKKDWRSTYGIGHILVTVKCLLIYPNPESALDEEAGKLLLEDYESYCSRARLITSVHATPRIKPPEFETSAPTSEGVLVAQSTESAPPPGDPISLPVCSTSSQQKSSLAPPQPLQPSPANTRSNSTPKTDKDHTVPSPLSMADPNIVGVTHPVSTKPTKRPVATGTSGAEKRKKALKRL